MATEQHNVRVYYRLESAQAQREAATIRGRLNAAERAGNSSALALRNIGTGMVVGAAISAVGALTARTIELNGQAESTALALAGMMQVGGLTAAGANGFRDALAMSERTMDKIRRDAAALPGEASDFITVFRGGLAGAIRAGLSDPGAIADFTNRFGAVAIALQVDSEQAGRDLNLMLSGRAGAQVAMWNRLGDAIGKSAKEFNALDPAQRLRLLQTALGSYQPMIDAYANTWDAISSTATSSATELLRVGGKPLFEFAKRNLEVINKLFGDSESALQRLAGSVSNGLVDALRTAGGAAMRAFRVFDRWTGSTALLTTLDEITASVSRTITRAQGAASRGNGVGMAGGAIGLAAGGPLGALLGGTIASALTHTPQINATLANLSAALGSLLLIVGPLLGSFGTLTEFLGTTLASILPGASAVLASFIGAVVSVAIGLIGIINGLWATIGPSIINLGQAIGEFLSALAGALGPALLWLGGHFLELARTLATYLGPAVRWVANALASLFRWLASKLRAFGVSMGGEASTGDAPAPATGDTISERLRALLGRFSGGANATSDQAVGGAAARRRAAQPARRGNTTINQHNHYTVNEAHNPERLFVEMRRHARQAVQAAQTESPLARVLRG